MIESAIKKLFLYYYLVFVLLILTAVLGHFLSLKLAIDTNSARGVSAQTFSIFILLIFIPSALKIFSVKVNKLSKNEDLNIIDKINKYVFWSNIRLAMIAFSLLINVLFYYLIQNNSMLFCAAISAVAVLFCRPKKDKMLEELNITEE